MLKSRNGQILRQGNSILCWILAADVVVAKRRGILALLHFSRQKTVDGLEGDVHSGLARWVIKVEISPIFFCGEADDDRWKAIAVRIVERADPC